MAAPSSGMSRPPPLSQSNFDKAMVLVMKHEGGFSNDKNDPGGITRYGISLRFLKQSHIDPNGDGKEDSEDIIHLSRTQADQIYYKEWYLKYHYNQINDLSIMTDILDFSINAGASQCHKIVKRAINDIINEPIEVNGVLDKDTIEIINLIEPSILHSAINHQQELFYRSIVKRNPQLKVFLKGWILRSKD